MRVGLCLLDFLYPLLGPYDFFLNCGFVPKGEGPDLGVQEFGADLWPGLNGCFFLDGHSRAMCPCLSQLKHRPSCLKRTLSSSV